MVAFRIGAYEVNPLVAHLTVIFWAFRGVLISKLIVIGVAMASKAASDHKYFLCGKYLWNSANLLSA